MLDEMRSFVLLAEEGSLQKVAERLPLTQPAVSRQIQRLEQALGADLLDRRMKPPGLTPIGAEVLARSRQILAAYDEMRNLAKRAEPEGLLRLGVANGLADDGFANIVSDIRKHFPRVALHLATGWSDHLAEQFERGHLDAVLLLSRGSARGDVAVVGQEALAIIASSKTTLKRAQAKSLHGQSWILSPEPCDARSRLASAMARKGYRLNIAAEVQDPRLQLALVRKGVGLSLMSRRLLVSAPPPGITVVQIDGLDLVLDIQVQRSPHLLSLGKVVDMIAERLQTLARH